MKHEPMLLYLFPEVNVIMFKNERFYKVQLNRKLSIDSEKSWLSFLGSYYKIQMIQRIGIVQIYWDLQTV